MEDLKENVLEQLCRGAQPLKRAAAEILSQLLITIHFTSRRQELAD